MSTVTPIRDTLEEPAAAVDAGRRKIEWAADHMPIMAHVRDTFEAERPLEGERISMAMHVEAKTAVLVETLAAGGATVSLTGCNPLSTHDDVSAALDATDGITSYAKRGVEDDAYYGAIDATLELEPTITVDDGMDLVAAVHESHRELLPTIVGGCEETTTGVHRLRAMAADGALEYPVFAVNDTPMKRLFDNIHGTGESALASLAMTTNLSWAGKTVVVSGFGYCGKGVARKAAGQNAKVIVTEVEPRRALEAHMEGFSVQPMDEAAPVGEVFITTTGNRDVITAEHFSVMPDGAVLANAGHFDIEIDIPALASLAVDRFDARDGIETFELEDGRRISVVADGRLVNLATPVSLGHPIEVMDQSFGIQSVCVEELADRGDDYDAGVHEVPDELDAEIAEIKLAAEGIEYDTLSEEQREYMASWDHGT